MQALQNSLIQFLDGRQGFVSVKHSPLPGKGHRFLYPDELMWYTVVCVVSCIQSCLNLDGSGVFQTPFVGSQLLGTVLVREIRSGLNCKKVK